jgi:diacylglycerol kinase family enzyme
MHVAPHASLDDGQFDVITLGDLNPVEVLYHIPKIYQGTHLRISKVTECRAVTVAVESRQRMLIQADGEPVGEGPALFRVLPGAMGLWG